jgi:hypothetical protein
MVGSKMGIRNDLFKNSQIIDCPNDRCEEEIKETDTKCPTCFCDFRGIINATENSKELLLWD